MKLSDAIIKGYEKVHQIRGDYQMRDVDGNIAAACPLGAACFAVAPDRYVGSWHDVSDLFPEIETYFETAMGEGTFSGSLGEYVVALNDGTLLPPEAIVEKIRSAGY